VMTARAAAQQLVQDRQLLTRARAALAELVARVEADGGDVS